MYTIISQFGRLFVAAFRASCLTDGGDTFRTDFFAIACSLPDTLALSDTEINVRMRVS